MFFAGELGRIMFSIVASEFIRGALRKSGDGLHGSSIEGVGSSKKGAYTMGYDLIGAYQNDDDDFGSIGADLLIGADDSDLLEALAIEGMGNSEMIGNAGDNARQAQAVRRIQMKNAAAVVQTAMDKRRRYPLGFVPTVIVAATSAQIPSQPQNLFRPERLVIPSDIAFDLGVRDIKVGNQSQYAQSVEVPAALFSEVAINTGVTFDTAEVGNQVSVDVRNKSASDVNFSAGLVGSVAKG